MPRPPPRADPCSLLCQFLCPGPRVLEPSAPRARQGAVAAPAAAPLLGMLQSLHLQGWVSAVCGEGWKTSGNKLTSISTPLNGPEKPKPAAPCSVDSSSCCWFLVFCPEQQCLSQVGGVFSHLAWF